MQSVSVSLGVLVIEKKRAVMTHLDRQSCIYLENCFRDFFYNLIGVSCRTRGFPVGGGVGWGASLLHITQGFADIITMLCTTYFDRISDNKNKRDCSFYNMTTFLVVTQHLTFSSLDQTKAAQPPQE